MTFKKVATGIVIVILIISLFLVIQLSSITIGTSEQDVCRLAFLGKDFITASPEVQGLVDRFTSQGKINDEGECIHSIGDELDQLHLENFADYKDLLFLLRGYQFVEPDREIERRVVDAMVKQFPTDQSPLEVGEWLNTYTATAYLFQKFLLQAAGGSLTDPVNEPVEMPNDEFSKILVQMWKEGFLRTIDDYSAAAIHINFDFTLERRDGSEEFLPLLADDALRILELNTVRKFLDTVLGAKKPARYLTYLMAMHGLETELWSMTLEEGIELDKLMQQYLKELHREEYLVFFESTWLIKKIVPLLNANRLTREERGVIMASLSTYGKLCFYAILWEPKEGETVLEQ